MGCDLDAYRKVRIWDHCEQANAPGRCQYLYGTQGTCPRQFWFQCPPGQDEAWQFLESGAVLTYRDQLPSEQERFVTWQFYWSPVVVVAQARLVWQPVPWAIINEGPERGNMNLFVEKVGTDPGGTTYNIGRGSTLQFNTIDNRRDYTFTQFEIQSGFDVDTPEIVGDITCTPLRWPHGCVADIPPETV